MTKQSPLQARHDAAAARVQDATDALHHRQQAVARHEADFNRLTEALQANPKEAELDFARGRARGDLGRAQHHADQAQAELGIAQRELAAVERLLGAEVALKKARAAWTAASASQVEATKTAQAARDKLAKLDGDLLAEQSKSAAAQDAQRAAILAEKGYSDKPAAKVSAVQEALLGSAAVIDALRSARPDLEAKVAAAETALVRRDEETRQAVQAILSAKAAMAESAALEALEQCRAAVHAYHAASQAAGRHGVAHLVLYDQTANQWAAYVEREAERLRASAFAGE